MMWPSLRPILLGIFLFLLMNVVATVALHGFPEIKENLSDKSNNKLPRKLAQLQATSPTQRDVLVLGTSQTNNNFATDTFDHAFSPPLNSFNLGLPGTRYDIMLTLLEFHVSRYGPPKLLVLEVFDAALKQSETRHYYTPAQQYLTLVETDPGLLGFIRQHRLISPRIRKEVILSSLSVFYRYRSLFMPISLQRKVLEEFKTVTHRLPGPFHSASHASGNASDSIPDNVAVSAERRAKGWRPRDAVPAMESEAGIRENAIEGRKFYLEGMSTVSFTRLEAILAYCRKKNIPVVLLRWPDHPAYEGLFKESSLNRPFETGLARLQQTYSLPLIDLNRTRPDDIRGLYADTRHLSAEGAIMFTHLLARELSPHWQAIQHTHHPKRPSEKCFTESRYEARGAQNRSL